MKTKHYSFVATDTNIWVHAASKKEAIKKIKESGVTGCNKANTKNVFQQTKQKHLNQKKS